MPSRRPTRGANSHYPGNRSPLAPNPLSKLPLVSVRPEGWLRCQLVLETKGFSGKLKELSEFCKFEGNEYANAVRLHAAVQVRQPAGILEWRVGE